VNTSILRFTIQMYFWTSTTRFNAPQQVTQPANVRRSLRHSCSGRMLPILQRLVQQRCGRFTCSLVTSQNMSDASQILEQQCIWHTYLRYQTRSKTNSSHFTINGVHKKRKSSPTVAGNSCTRYGSSCLMMSSSMPPPMAWLCTAWTELSDGCIHAS